LFVYLAAMRSGWTPNSIIEDKPITIGGWSPENHDHVFRGPITLREAFARSSNAATVRLSETVGRANVLRAARDLGISTPLPNEPSVALGTGGVSLLELTSAYAAIDSGSYPVVARGLPAEPQQQQGFSSFFSPHGGALDPARDRAPMLNILYAAANEGTGHRAAVWLPTFGKTGTTQDNRDAVFVGFAGDLVVGIWVGRDDNKSLGRVSGGTVPAEIWHDFMTSALAIDHTPGPQLPTDYAPGGQSGHLPAEHPSPLPADWSDATKSLRDLASGIERLFR
jgi:penicillin-binding protein 1A